MSDPVGAAPAAGQEERARTAMRVLADRYWDELLELDPILATHVGAGRYDDRLPDTTEEGVVRAEGVHRRALAEAASIVREDLDEPERTTLDVVESVARRQLDGIRWRTDRLAAVTHLFGPGQLLVTLGTIQPTDTPEHLDRYLDRLAAFPAFLRGVQDLAMGGADEGITAPALVVDRTLGQVERLLQIQPEESPGMGPVAGASPEIRERAAHVLRDVVWPAYRGYADTLRAYRAVARDSVGLSALQDGEARYATEILGWTTMPMTPGEVHGIGEEEMEAIEEERRSVAARLGFGSPDEALASHAASGSDTPASREEIVRLAEAQVRRGWDAAPAAFGRLARAECEVRPVEEFRERDIPLAYYQPPSGDGSRPGIYYVNTSDHLERRLHMFAATTFHEANPGHHFQISIEQEYSDRPALRRFGGLLVGSAFIEGWALYSERLADELGLYADEHERLGMLSAQAWRAARLVVDTGIHAMGWDRERAVEYLDRATGGPRMNTEVEVDRYIAWPGQALAYKIGQREIERIRREAQRGSGPDFSLPRFHDRLLALGSLPLPALRREIASGER